MAGIGKFFSDAAKLLFMGVGISDSGTIPRKVDLWKIASGERWKLFQRSVANIYYKGKEAVQFEDGAGDGVALYQGLELSDCKIDLSLAAIRQNVGLIVRAKDDASYELVTFQLETESQKLSLTVRFQAQSAAIELPPYLLEEWVSVRVVLNPRFTAVFVSGNNTPCLKVPASQPPNPEGLIGLWVESQSPGLFADLKYIQSRKKDFEGV